MRGGAGAVAEELRGGAQSGGKGRSGSSRQQDKHAQRETLYDAYNMLHTLAQVRETQEREIAFFFSRLFFSPFFHDVHFSQINYCGLEPGEGPEHPQEDLLAPVTA